MARLFPGIGPDSYCRNFGDAPPGAMQRVFEPAMADLHRIIVKTRSLIVVDWRLNREIGRIIEKCAAGLTLTTAVKKEDKVRS
jgi:hypothetical protein